MAVPDRADIVIGKVVGHGKRVQPAPFRKNIHGQPFDSISLLGAAHAAQAVPPPLPGRARRSASRRGGGGWRTTCSWSRPTSRPSASPCSPTAPSTTGCRARARPTPPRRASTPRPTSTTCARCSTSSSANTEPGEWRERVHGPLVPRQDAPPRRRQGLARARRGLPRGALRRGPQARAGALRRGRARADGVQPARALQAAARRGGLPAARAAGPLRDAAALARAAAQGRRHGHAPRGASSTPSSAGSDAAALRAPRRRAHPVGAAGEAARRDRRGGPRRHRRAAATAASRCSCENVDDGSQYMLPARTEVADPGGAGRPAGSGCGCRATVPIAPTAAAGGSPLPPGQLGGARRSPTSPASRSGGEVPGAEKPLVLTTYRPGGSSRARRCRRRRRAAPRSAADARLGRARAQADAGSSRRSLPRADRGQVAPDRPAQVADAASPRRPVAQVAQQRPHAGGEHGLGVDARRGARARRPARAAGRARRTARRSRRSAAFSTRLPGSSPSTSSRPVGSVSTRRQIRSGRWRAEDAEELVDVARPGAGAPVARGLVDRARQDVVEHDDARPAREPLDADEVAQRELRQVHAVDEREVDGLAAAAPRSGFARMKNSSLDSCSSVTLSPSSTCRSNPGSTPSAGHSASARLSPWRRPISR